MSIEYLHKLLGYWCEALGIADAPRLEVVSQSEIPGCDAMADFDDQRATVWRVRMRSGDMGDVEKTLVHELLHVRSGCTDACHEAWICDVASALVSLRRAAKAEK